MDGNVRETLTELIIFIVFSTVGLRSEQSKQRRQLS